MKKQHQVFFAAAAALHAACAPSVDDPIERDLAASVQSLGTPVPCGAGVTFNGSTAHLLLLDAVASCTNEIVAGSDFISELRVLAETTTGSTSLTKWPQDWRTFRNTEANNCLDGQNTSTNLTTDHMPREGIPTHQYTLQGGSTNLCVASVLRGSSPGATGAGALLLPAADQLLLAESVREFSGTALVNYAQLAAAFSARETTPSSTQISATSIPYMAAWIKDPQELTSAGFADFDVTEMAGDFADAARLHVLASEEILDLMARSRSVGLPYSADAATDTPSDAQWGPESWHQRLLAAAFGGDPLAIADGGPWAHTPWLNTPPGLWEYFFQLPGGSVPWFKTPSVASAWPSASILPYATNRFDSPEAEQLMGLARRYDLLDLEMPDQCSVDVVATAQKLYSRVEASLRFRACKGSTGIPCLPIGLDFDTLDIEHTELWTTYGILPEHAETLVGTLSDLVGTCSGRGVMALTARSGTDIVSLTETGIHLDQDFDVMPWGLEGSAPSFTRFGSIRLPDASELLDNAQDFMQGFSSPGFHFTKCVNSVCAKHTIPEGHADSAKRRLGTMQTLVAARRLLVSAKEASSAMLDSDPRKEHLERYLSTSDKILSLIDATIGPVSITLSPRTTPVSWWYDLSRPTLEVINNGFTHAWSTSIDAPDEDFWRAPQNDEDVGLWIAFLPVGGENGGVQAALRSPDATVTGLGAGDLLLALGKLDDPQYLVEQMDHTFLPDDKVHWENFGVWLQPGRYTVTAWRTTQATFDAVKSLSEWPEDTPLGEFQVLADDVLIEHPYDPTATQHLAYGGALGKMLDRQVKPYQYDPRKHAYDGFGLPTGWIPPFTAGLLGGSPEQSSVDYYLRTARTRADDATEAVRWAFEGLIAQTQDEAALKAATARSAAGTKEALVGLCGAEQADGCDPTVNVTAIKRGWYPSLESLRGTVDDQDNAIDLLEITAPPGQLKLPDGTLAVCAGLPRDFPEASTSDQTLDIGTGNEFVDQGTKAIENNINAWKPASGIEGNDADLAKLMVRCFLARRIRDFLLGEIPLATAVEVELDSPAVPTFSDYAGGQLQQAFVEQWRAVKSPDERFDALVKAAEASEARIDVASAVLARESEIIQINCGPAAMANAMAQGMNVGIFPSWSPGPLLSQIQKCNELLAGTDVIVKEQTVAIKDAFLSISSSAVGLIDAQAAMVQSGAAIDLLASQTDLAVARAELEAELTGAQLTTSFGVYRRYRDYDLWRARVLLDDARRRALAARRAIEARYVVDMSSINSAEAFVAAPAIWADEIYGYDLSLPAAVGLDVSNDVGGDGIFPNKVADYVSNLEGFISGFPVERPSAVALEDVDVVEIPGLAMDDVRTLTNDFNDETLDVLADTSTWQVLCDGEELMEPTWFGIPMPEVGGVNVACLQACPCDPEEEDCAAKPACTAHPIRARVAFNLDPWGRRNDSIANPPYEKRYNARWTRFAVNLVGTGIKDCTKSDDPYGCYASAYLRYDVRHVGRAWVSDFAGAWHGLNVPMGQVEGGKGIAAERWLDPLSDGWGTPYIGAVSRTEFMLRPFGGAYVLEIEAGPEVRLDRLERIQLLLGSTYWVAQQ